MEIIVRICTEADLPGAAKLWNAVVEEGRAFPQAETLTGEDIQGFFDQQSYTGVAVDETGDVKRYTPLLSQAEASAQQTKKLLSHVFSGRASLLINHLVDSGEITLKEMEDLMDMMRKAGKG
jgi:hypothetical protein